MKKTRNIFKKFICLILTSILTFGSYVFPVFAALPEDSEAPSISDVMLKYDEFKDELDGLNAEITTIRSSAMSGELTTAVERVEQNVSSIENMFHFNLGEEKLIVRTTEFNVITVTVDFTEPDLAISLANDLMKNQVLKDTETILDNITSNITDMKNFLTESIKVEHQDYLIKINELNVMFNNIMQYIPKLVDLGVEVNHQTYMDYSNEITRLTAASNTPDINAASELLESMKLHLDDSTNNTGLKQILKSKLLEKYTELNELATENSTIPGMDAVIDATANTKTEIENNDAYDLLSNDYLTQLDNYNNLIKEQEKTNPEQYIKTSVSDAFKSLSESFGLKITKEQYETINTLIGTNVPTTVEQLIGFIDVDELTEKLISGELTYEVLVEYVKFVNIHQITASKINGLTSELGSSVYSPDIDDAVLTDIFSESGKYIDYLKNQIKNESKTEEERLEILNKLDLVEISVLKFGNTFSIQPNTDAIIPIMEKIEELREFYNKSCDNTLSNLKVNDIELDLKEESHKIYVGNDVTKLDLSYLKNNEKATVEVVNSEELKVGSNEVIIKVTAENGEIREYVLEVIRAEKEVAATTTENNTKEEVKATQMSTNNYSDETIDNTVEEETEEEKSNTSDSNEKYNEELEEEKGLNGLTVLLIVVGIALVGFGVYKIFGEKEDKKIERAFSNPQPKKQQTSSKKKNNKRK